MDVTIIPSMPGFSKEPLKPEMEALGVRYTDNHRDYSEVTENDVVINFCGAEFLDDIEKICKKTQRTCFVNCMTWLFPKEREAHSKNQIAFSLYQRPQVRGVHRAELVKLGSKAKFLNFKPFFDSSMIEFLPRKNNDRFTIGRISRQDADKFAVYTWHIWEYAVAPSEKRGICLGYDMRSVQKAGNPPSWVERHLDHSTLPVKEFYRQCDVIVQSTDTTENWPRIGFEAMYSGCPLVVDNKGGWRYMVDHEESGFLCDTPQEFIYWTSRLAFEPQLREEVAIKALKKALSLSGEGPSRQSWKEVFEILFN